MTSYLNVDLDLYSQFDLQPLVTAMGKKVIVLHVGRYKRTYRAHLELASYNKSPDSTICGFCVLIRALPSSARRLWNSAKVRDFNIGVQASIQTNAYELALASDTVKAISKVDGRIVFTVYAPEKPTERAKTEELASK